MKNFLKKWGVFLSIAFGPGSVIFILLTLFGLIFAYVFKENALFTTLLSILSSIFAGIAGNFIKDDYDAYLGKNTLEKKGRSALRNLQTISTQLCNLRLWVCDFQKARKKGNKDPLFDEIDRHLSTIQLNIASGLEDWVDIVPDLKEKAQENAEIERKYKNLAQSYFNELLENRKELISSSDKERTEELKSKISNIEKQIKSLRNEQAHAVGGISVAEGWGGRALNSSIGSYGVSASLGLCDNCHSNLIKFDSRRGVHTTNYCDECKKRYGI